MKIVVIRRKDGRIELTLGIVYDLWKSVEGELGG